MRNAKPLLAALALALLSPLAFAQPANDAVTALERVRTAGYVAPYELEYRYNYWTIEATTAEGLRVDVLVDPATGSTHAFDSRGTGAISAAEVRRILSAAGYTRISDIEFDDGFWEAEATDRYGRRLDLVLHPLTGAILNAPQNPGNGSAPLTAAQILSKLTAAGYTRIRDLEYDSDGYWEADAINPRGQRVELRIDPYTGAVLREELDD